MLAVKGPSNFLNNTSPHQTHKRQQIQQEITSVMNAYDAGNLWRVLIYRLHCSGPTVHVYPKTISCVLYRGYIINPPYYENHTCCRCGATNSIPAEGRLLKQEKKRRNSRGVVDWTFVGIRRSERSKLVLEHGFPISSTDHRPQEYTCSVHAVHGLLDWRIFMKPDTNVVIDISCNGLMVCSLMFQIIPRSCFMGPCLM